MKETTITEAGSNEGQGTGTRESGTRGGLTEADWMDAEWTESDWFGDWLKLAHRQESSK